jgi:ribosomal protein S18 acetylase RimI-like enzyme
VSKLFVVEKLAAHHDRLSFSCGVDALDRYLHAQAGQDVRRRVSNCFVAVSSERTIAGYYTLAATGVPLNDLPLEYAKRLPRYPIVPAALVGRLAVDIRFAGKGLGSMLLYDAMARAADAAPAVFAVIVDAKDDRAAKFYQRFGFRAFASRPMTLYYPLNARSPA